VRRSTENSLIDSKEFFKPVITPYELELALTKYAPSKTDVCLLNNVRLSRTTRTTAHTHTTRHDRTRPTAHARRGKEWTGEYITDFSEILPSLAPSSAAEGADAPHKNEEPSEEEEEEPRLSLIDGKLKSSVRPGTLCRACRACRVVCVVRRPNSSARRLDAEASGGEAGQELVVSGGQALAVSVPTAATFLAQRQWKGLEQKLGETEVKLAEEGRAGIPKGYTVGEDSSRT